MQLICNIDQHTPMGGEHQKLTPQRFQLNEVMIDNKVITNPFSKCLEHNQFIRSLHNSQA